MAMRENVQTLTKKTLLLFPFTPKLSETKFLLAMVNDPYIHVAQGTSIVSLSFQNIWRERDIFWPKNHSRTFLPPSPYSQLFNFPYMNQNVWPLLLHSHEQNKGMERVRTNFLSQFCSQNLLIMVLQSSRCYTYLVFISRSSIFSRA